MTGFILHSSQTQSDHFTLCTCVNCVRMCEEVRTVYYNAAPGVQFLCSDLFHYQAASVVCALVFMLDLGAVLCKIKDLNIDLTDYKVLCCVSDCMMLLCL